MYSEQQVAEQQQNYEKSNDEEDEEDNERECTNLTALVLCVIFVAALLGFVGYCSMNGKIHNLLAATDDCGNICGELNEGNLSNCSSHDMRKLTKLLTYSSRPFKNSTVKIRHHKCVESCPTNYTESFNRCLKHGQNFNDLQEISNAFLSSWYLIAIICFVAFVFSYICLLLYRYFAKYVIWIINIGFLIGVFAIGTIFMTNLLGKSNVKTGLIFYLVGTLSALALYIFRKKVALVAGIFKESSKALMDVPAILFEPILTFIALLASFVGFLFFIITIEAAQKSNPTSTKIPKIAIAAHIFNGIGFIWFTQFILGCQHFLIAGTVSKWYFCRDKTKLESPLWQTFSTLLRFHLGSICFGSMLLTLVKIIKMIVKAIKKSIDKESDNMCAQFLACFCSYLVDLLDKAMEYLVRNAYIIISLDGTPFVKSGKRAFNLIKDNLDECYSVNQFGDIVLVVCRVLITLIAGFLAYEIMKKPGFGDPMFFPMALSIIFAFLIAHCFVTVFEMTVDTIFICYCLDIEENDGVTSPYYMSEKLLNIMLELRGAEPNSNDDQGVDGNDFQMQPQDNPESGYSQYPNNSMYNQQPMYPQQQGFQPQPNYQQSGYPEQQQTYSQGPYQYGQTYPMQQSYGGQQANYPTQYAGQYDQSQQNPQFGYPPTGTDQNTQPFGNQQPPYRGQPMAIPGQEMVPNQGFLQDQSASYPQFQPPYPIQQGYGQPQNYGQNHPPYPN